MMIFRSCRLHEGRSVVHTALPPRPGEKVDVVKVNVVHPGSCADFHSFQDVARL
jgi:hypothetical protein